MRSEETTLAPDHLWVIERDDTGQWLGTRDRGSMGGLEFGARVPIFYGSLKSARAAWLKFSCQMGWLSRSISLAGSPGKFKRGPDYNLWPRVKYRKLELVRTAFAVDTPKEMGFEE